MKQRKVVFAAMSGVRITDPDLLLLGLTLPGFVERGKVIASLPSLGLLTLAGWTPPHWDAIYLEINDNLDEKANEIIKTKPDLVAISSLTARIKDAYKLSKLLKDEGLKVVIGGLHATAIPADVKPFADSVIVGDGEQAWVQLLNDFENNNLQPFYKIPHTFKDSDPVPRFDLLDINKYNRLTMQTVRGCPLNCEFCAASRLLGPMRRKPISLIRKELEAILSIWEMPFIELADDNTFFSKKWGGEVAKLLKEYGIKWFTETDISVADSPHLLENLAQSGCAQLLIGLESAHKNSLKSIDPRSWKWKQKDSYFEKVRRIQDFGISVNGCFVLGLDEDTTEIFSDTLEYVRELELSEVQITILTPFPGTSAYERMKQENRLIDERSWEKCTLFDITYHPKRMTTDELREGFSWLVSELYSEQETQKRKSLFRKYMKNARIIRGKDADAQSA